MRRRLTLFVVLALTLLALPAVHYQTVSAEGDITVKAGGGEMGYAVNQFMPNTVTVAAGATIAFAFEWSEPHSVTFGVPGPAATSPATYDGSAGLNTDLIFGPAADFEVKFPKAGSYQYFCIIHPKMIGTVNVIGAGGQGEPDSKLSASTRAKAQYSSAITQLKNLAAALNAVPVAITQQPGGASQYSLAVGGVIADGSDVQQFFPGAAKIKVGDSIKWTNKTETPHTVTFNAPPGPPQGDPLATPISKPAPAFDGTGFWNSGTIWSIPDPAARNTFEMTFGKAGTYTYVCILHAPQGMVGTVAVEAAPVAPRPPSTGTGTVEPGDSPRGLFAAGGLLVIAAGAWVIANSRRWASDR